MNINEETTKCFGLVYYIVLKYYSPNYGVDLDDLYQQGIESLLMSAKKYDRTRGKFSSFAGKVVQNTVRTYLRNEMRLNERGQKYLPDMIVDDCSLSLEIKDEFSYVMRIADRILSERQKEIINKFFGLNGSPEKTLANISRELKITKQAVSQTRDVALKKILGFWKREMFVLEKNHNRKLVKK